jgi:hypothetical protein
MPNLEVEAIKGSMLIRGQEVPVVTQNLEQAKLSFYAENPRVYSAICGNGQAPTQQQIEAHLLELEHVRELIGDIKLNKGLLEPLIVRAETLEVLEGNSRLAAYRHLAKSDPVKWGYVKCTVLPYDIDESLIFALLGQFHIKGKKDWAPYEQAGFLYRRFKNHHVDIKDLALEIGIPSTKVQHLVETYEFMVKNDEEDINRWSYYDEYLKSRKIQRARKKYPDLDSVVIEKIRNKEIERAVDLREQLPVICNSQKALAKFVSEVYDFSDAYLFAVEAGGTATHLKSIKKFREWITKPKLEGQIINYHPKIRNGIIYELNKIESKVKHLIKKLE